MSVKFGLLLSTACVALVTAGSAMAADTLPVKAKAPEQTSSYPKNWDTLIGSDPISRFFNYYALEWGHDGPPPDPTAPPGRRSYWPTTPMTTPPMPFTEWPYGGTQNLGVTRPNSTDSPLMVAIAHTSLGQWMSDSHIQMYGWVNVGGNMSTNTTKPGGNWPAAYGYTPNTVQLDQAVLYIERVPDTVQKDHVDWGFRLSGIYGENYRYTTAYGVASYQLLGHNLINGYDFPMVYGEAFVPNAAPEGLLIRVGRYISIPDIEAQLAPNNYMYSHSMTYTFDNYTNTGINTTWGLTKNWTAQVGVTIGTEAPPWHWGQRINNPYPNTPATPNPVYPDTTFLIDPGAKPSISAALRYTTDSGNDNIYLAMDGINDGVWGYNNLQWYGITWYHKFNSQWHLAFEAYTLSQKNVLNAADPLGIAAAGGYPFSTQASGMPWNMPGLAFCSNPAALTCTARVYTAVAYLNYSWDSLNNLSIRPEFYFDEEGQRTGTATRYANFAVGWQHWFSPQIEMRPEVAYYHSLNAPAFNGNCNQVNFGNPASCTPANKSSMLMFAADVIIHF
jgi:hypothetical protein